jgi:hypothetical protein
MSDHAEAIALARRLIGVETGGTGDCRRALLLYWYGCGASRLRLEEDASRCGDLARLSARIAALAADPSATPETLRRIGIALQALVTQPGAARPRRRARSS